MVFACIRTAIIVAWVLVALFPSQASAQSSTIAPTSDKPMNLAFVLPKAQPTNTSPHLSNSARIGYDSAVLGTGLLIASDDRGLYRTVVGPNGPSSSESRIAKDVTHLGDLTYVAPALGAVYLLGGKTNHDIAWKSSVALIRAGAIGLVLKELVGRERPGSANPGSAGVFHLFRGSSDVYQSFPSGHTLIAFSVASVWAGEAPKERYLAYGLASAVGLSRIIGADHWPSDVFFGALIGITQGRQALHGNVDLVDFKF